MNISKKRVKRIATDIAFEIVGSMLVAIALYNFAVASEFPMTGVSGIAMILYRLFGLPIGVMTIVLNIPITIMCYKLLGKGFLLRSIRCTIISSVFVDVIAPMFPIYTGSRMLSAICTGVFSGIGYALIFMRNSSTGGTDFITMSIKALKPHLSLGKITFIVDAVIVFISGMIFKDVDGIIYGMIIPYIISNIIDKTMYGMASGKLAFIVTDVGDTIPQIIEECCGRGSTIIHAEGGYKKSQKQVIICACNNKQMYPLQRAVKAADPRSFIMVVESNEVLGQGFKVLEDMEVE